MNLKERILVFVVLVTIGIGSVGLGYRSGYDNGYVAGWNTVKDEVVLGLIERDGYYIINENYGSFKLNTTDRYEALKQLRGEISPFL